MMPRLYTFIGLLALSLFTYAQYRGVGLFDDTAASQPTRNASARSAFHK